MAADATLTLRLDRLIELFNSRSLDLPDGLFDRRTRFLLNGAPFETLLGRSPEDPLILMLARGPAGYRFAIKALQHAIPDARIQRGDIGADGSGATGQIRLSGMLRGSGQPIETLIDVTLTPAPAGHVDTAAVVLDERDLGLIREARLRS